MTVDPRLFCAACAASEESGAPIDPVTHMIGWLVPAVVGFGGGFQGYPYFSPDAFARWLTLPLVETTFFAVGDVAAHDGYVTSRQSDGAWTYQDVTGPHGTVLLESTSEDEARAALDAWLVCDATARGAYCYAHNPRPHAA